MEMQLLESILLLLVVAGIVYLYNIRGNFKQNLQKLEQEHLKFKKDLIIVDASTVEVGERVNKFEDYLQRLSLRQDVAELKQSAIASYVHAAKIIEIGGSIDDIVAGCGLTRVEAELVVTLHKKSP